MEVPRLRSVKNKIQLVKNKKIGCVLFKVSLTFKWIDVG